MPIFQGSGKVDRLALLAKKLISNRDKKVVLNLDILFWLKSEIMLN